MSGMRRENNSEKTKQKYFEMKKKKIRTRRHYIYIPHRAIHLNRFLSDSGFFHLRRIIQFFIYLFFGNFRLVDRFSWKKTNKTITPKFRSNLIHNNRQKHEKNVSIESLLRYCHIYLYRPKSFVMLEGSVLRDIDLILSRRLFSLRVMAALKFAFETS